MIHMQVYRGGKILLAETEIETYIPIKLLNFDNDIQRLLLLTE